MQSNSRKYRQLFGAILLSVYLSFILIGTIHHHSFDFLEKEQYSNQTTSPGKTDLSSDFFSICSLHQFSQTIYNNSYSSSNIVLALTKIDVSLYSKQIGNVNSPTNLILPSRAPPTIS